MSKRTAGSRPLGRAVSGAWYEVSPSLGSRLLLGCLTPASWAYGAVSSARGNAYDRGWLRVAKAPIPVVSVGNLVVGGAGKTPVVMEIVDRLASMGHKVAVVSRGYGSEASGPRVVSDGNRIFLDGREAGDEPLLIARRCSAAAVLVGSSRADLVEHAAAELSCTVAVLDDGMQHRRLHRDLEVVVVDASAPVGNGRLLPRGPMRERTACLSRAHLVWLTRVDEIPSRPFEDSTCVDAMLARAGCPVVRSRYEVEAVTDLSGTRVGGADHLAGERVLALSGIARPASFHEALARVGARIVGVRAYPDHHVFTEEELTDALEEARAAQAVAVTTEKDAERIGRSEKGILALRVRAVLTDGSSDLERVLKKLPAAVEDTSELG